MMVIMYIFTKRRKPLPCVHTSQQSELTFFARKRQSLNVNRNIFLASQVAVALWEAARGSKTIIQPSSFASSTFQFLATQ